MDKQEADAILSEFRNRADSPSINNTRLLEQILNSLVGKEEPAMSVLCPDCMGTGQVNPPAVDISDYCPCPTCEGTGKD
jgi:DnaJ-class molecular chaperone